MTVSSTTTSVLDDTLARRNARVLAASQAIGGSTAPIVIGIGGLAGHYLLDDDKALATLPVTTFIIGVALSTVPAALLMRRVGRRLGFQLGALMLMLGGVLSGYAVLEGLFWLLCLGTAVSGSGNAFVQQYRFAAADTASDSFRPRAISWVLAGGVVTGIVGPQIVILSKDMLAPIPFAGAFLAQVGLGLVLVLILGLLRIPVPPKVVKGGEGRPLAEIASQPRFVVAVICGIVSYGLMSLVMTASPLAMIACDLTQDEAMLGIQWHVIAMFAPSFFTGRLISRFGKEPVIATGLLLLVGCALVALSGITLAHFWLALILLGVGWNFGFIGATAMVTDTYRPEERARAQALNDFLVFGFQALASISSGAVLHLYGWNTVNLIVLPLVALALAALLWMRLSARRAPVA